MKNPGKRNEVKDERFRKEFCLKQKKLRADKIRRKYLRLSQVFRKCHINEAEKNEKIEHPSTLRWMQRSNVTVGYHLSFSAPFTKAYLPPVDTTMVLETEAGERYEAKYLARLCRLSAGWRRFVLDKHLEEGDAVVFQLVEPTKFKVSIVKANAANEGNLPVHLFHPVMNHVKSSVSDKVNKQNGNPLVVYKRGGVPHQIAENYNPVSLRLRSRAAGSSMLLHNNHKGMLFSNIKSFEEFETALHGLLQNHEVPYGTLQGYYELCCSQNAFLHDHLFEGINPKFSCQIIIETVKKFILDTVSLTDAFRTCKLSTFLQKYAVWDQTLNAYENLGMNVSFLLDRLHHLKSFAVKAEEAKGRYKEACHERKFAEHEVRKLEVVFAKLCELNASKATPLDSAVLADIRDLDVLLAEFGKFFCQYDNHIDALKLEVKNHEHKFKEEVSSTWLVTDT